MPTTSLDAELQQLSHLLEILIINEADAAQTKLLNDIHQEIVSKTPALAFAKADDQQYEFASSAVEAANEKILEAIKDLDLVPDTIKALGKVVIMLGKLLDGTN